MNWCRCKIETCRLWSTANVAQSQHIQERKLHWLAQVGRTKTLSIQARLKKPAQREPFEKVQFHYPPKPTLARFEG